MNEIVNLLDMLLTAVGWFLVGGVMVVVLVSVGATLFLFSGKGK